jgi:hypothetical protein
MSIEVSANGDLDIQLMDTDTKKCLTGYACVQDKPSTMTQEGMSIYFSGDDRDDPVIEKVSTVSTITRDLTVNVSAYKSALGTIKYEYGHINPCPNPRPGCSPCSSYPCPPKTRPKCDGSPHVTCEPTCDTTQFEEDVVQTMLVDFRQHVEESQLVINSKINDVSTCNSDMASAVPQDEEGLAQFNKISSEVSVCEGHLAALHTEEASCKATMTTMMSTKSTDCSGLSIESMHAETCSSLCAIKDGETALQYISRLKVHYEELEAAYELKTNSCNSSSTAYMSTTMSCQSKTEDVVAMSAKCATIKQQKCVAGKEFATKSIQTCKTYDQCYGRGVSAYEALQSGMEAEEAKRQRAWASIQNLKCILKHWNGQGNLCQAVQAGNQCKDGIPEAPHVQFTSVPAKMKCTVLPDPCAPEGPTETEAAPAAPTGTEAAPDQA